MQTITKNIEAYKVGELEPEAFEKAYENWVELEMYGIGDQLSDYYGTRNYFYDIDGPEGDIKGLRLRTWIINNLVPLWTEPRVYKKGNKSRKSNIEANENPCFATGICSDTAIINIFEDFIANPRSYVDWEELRSWFEEEFESFLRAEEEYLLSEESFLNYCDCMEVLFTEDGEEIV